ncbi:MAG: porphobilinogen deaminase [Phycisphaerae bacterium]|nr:MAG: porphobilinogen deaminase [Phycisphaerae bacterium]
MTPTTDDFLIPDKPLRLGTRGSLLARTQSAWVARALERAYPGIRVELIIIKTTGDQIQNQPLAEIGGKGLFTKELEIALLDNRIDLAVHSYKDVPVTMPLIDTSELVIACCPKRADARDVIISRDPNVRSLSDLPCGATIATGSLRRQCQILDHRPDVRIVPIRGNIDSRVQRVVSGQFDATILALAGLDRCDMLNAPPFSYKILSIKDLTPSAGQGALAVQVRRDRTDLGQMLLKLHDSETDLCVQIERRVVHHLNGNCHSPIGVHVQALEDQFVVHACLGQTSGLPPVKRVVHSFSKDQDPDTIASWTAGNLK